MRLIKNAVIVNDGVASTNRGYVVIDGDKIAAVGEGEPPEQYRNIDTLDIEGRYLMPGAIDTHVHFREPGLTEKGTIATESAAAVAGGVTSYIEMPNTRPATTGTDEWDHKMLRAHQTSMANYAFFLGATSSNLNTLISADYSRVPGVKLFMGSSTGGMLVDDIDLQRRIFAEVPALIAVHAESEAIIRANRERISALHDGNPPLECHPQIRDHEACDDATYRAVKLATETGARLHVTHISTDGELRFFIPGDDVACKRITAETCPQYLLFSSDDYATRGARIKCNPAIKDAADRDNLRRAVAEGLIDTIATDHAPHRLADKQGNALTAASGMPGVQFSLALMLEMFGPETVVTKMAHNPATIFRIDRRGFLRPGYYADMVVVEHLDTTAVIDDSNVKSLCGWTPYHGLETHWRVVHTFVNGRQVVDDGNIIAANRAPLPLRFINNKI